MGQGLRCWSISFLLPSILYTTVHKSFETKKQKILPLLIPWDYIHKETLARSPWGHKVPDGQIIKARLKYLYFSYSIETTGFKLITSCPVELRAIKQVCDLQRDLQIISNIQHIT